MTQGFDHVYLETHNWDRAVAFWQRLGFEVEFATDHGSGTLRNPAGGPTIFLAEQPMQDPVGVEVVSDFQPTHWGTKVMVIQDPDGHRFRIEAPD
jgi:catechol 2,3-dioxygenase-like lactoylglutathione lyase family enzyme